MATNQELPLFGIRIESTEQTNNMWMTDKLGIATWKDNDSAWSFDARGGNQGIGVLISGSERRYVSLGPVDQNQLPPAAEQFVRGDQWHVNYPQGTGLYALRLALQPIEVTRNLLVLEAIVSIQTDLLDTHPKLDIDVDCIDIDSIVPRDQTLDDEVHGAGSAPISIAKNNDYCCSVLLDRHDQPFTTNHSTDSLLRLRLFGEFLEKGVIRRGRPWIVIDRRGGVTPEPELAAWLQQLNSSPLPLT